MMWVTLSLVFGVLFFFAWFMFATIESFFSDDVEIVYVANFVNPPLAAFCEYDYIAGED